MVNELKLTGSIELGKILMVPNCGLLAPRLPSLVGLTSHPRSCELRHVDPLEPRNLEDSFANLADETLSESKLKFRDIGTSNIEIAA